MINALGAVLESTVFDTNITSTRLSVLRGKFDLMPKVHTAKWKKFTSNNQLVNYYCFKGVMFCTGG